MVFMAPLPKVFWFREKDHGGRQKTTDFKLGQNCLLAQSKNSKVGVSFASRRAAPSWGGLIKKAANLDSCPSEMNRNC